jgi:hypothetical protein
MPLTRRSFGFAALGGMLAAPALAKAPFTGAQAPGIYRTRVGAMVFSRSSSRRAICRRWTRSPVRMKSTRRRT